MFQKNNGVGATLAGKKPVDGAKARPSTAACLEDIRLSMIGSLSWVMTSGTMKQTCKNKSVSYRYEKYFAEVLDQEASEYYHLSHQLYETWLLYGGQGGMFCQGRVCHRKDFIPFLQWVDVYDIWNGKIQTFGAELYFTSTSYQLMEEIQTGEDILLNHKGQIVYLRKIDKTRLLDSDIIHLTDSLDQVFVTMLTQQDLEFLQTADAPTLPFVDADRCRIPLKERKYLNSMNSATLNKAIQLVRTSGFTQAQLEYPGPYSWPGLDPEFDTRWNIILDDLHRFDEPVFRKGMRTFVEFDQICTRFITEKSLYLEDFVQLPGLGQFKLILFYYPPSRANHVLVEFARDVETLLKEGDKFLLLNDQLIYDLIAQHPPVLGMKVEARTNGRRNKPKQSTEPNKSQVNTPQPKQKQQPSKEYIKAAQQKQQEYVDKYQKEKDKLIKEAEVLHEEKQQNCKICQKEPCQCPYNQDKQDVSYFKSQKGGGKSQNYALIKKKQDEILRQLDQSGTFTREACGVLGIHKSWIGTPAFIMVENARNCYNERAPFLEHRDFIDPSSVSAKKGTHCLLNSVASLVMSGQDFFHVSRDYESHIDVIIKRLAFMHGFFGITNEMQILKQLQKEIPILLKPMYTRQYVEAFCDKYLFRKQKDLFYYFWYNQMRYIITDDHVQVYFPLQLSSKILDEEFPLDFDKKDQPPQKKEKSRAPELQVPAKPKHEENADRYTELLQELYRKYKSRDNVLALLDRFAPKIPEYLEKVSRINTSTVPSMRSVMCAKAYRLLTQQYEDMLTEIQVTIVEKKDMVPKEDEFGMAGADQDEDEDDDSDDIFGAQQWSDDKVENQKKRFMEEPKQIQHKQQTPIPKQEVVDFSFLDKPSEPQQMIKVLTETQQLQLDQLVYQPAQDIFDQPPVVDSLPPKRNYRMLCDFLRSKTGQQSPLYQSHLYKYITQEQMVQKLINITHPVLLTHQQQQIDCLVDNSHPNQQSPPNRLDIDQLQERLDKLANQNKDECDQTFSKYLLEYLADKPASSYLTNHHYKEFSEVLRQNDCTYRYYIDAYAAFLAQSDLDVQALRNYYDYGGDNFPEPDIGQEQYLKIIDKMMQHGGDPFSPENIASTKQYITSDTYVKTPGGYHFVNLIDIDKQLLERLDLKVVQTSFLPKMYLYDFLVSSLLNYAEPNKVLQETQAWTIIPNIKVPTASFSNIKFTNITRKNLLSRSRTQKSIYRNGGYEFVFDMLQSPIQPHIIGQQSYLHEKPSIETLDIEYLFSAYSHFNLTQCWPVGDQCYLVLIETSSFTPPTLNPELLLPTKNHQVSVSPDDERLFIEYLQYTTIKVTSDGKGQSQLLKGYLGYLKQQGIVEQYSHQKFQTLLARYWNKINQKYEDQVVIKRNGLWTAVASYLSLGFLTYCFKDKIKQAVSESPFKYGVGIFTTYALLDLAIKYKTRAVSTLVPSKIGNYQAQQVIVPKKKLVQPLKDEEELAHIGPVRGPVPEGFGYSTHKPPEMNQFEYNESCLSIQYYNEKQQPVQPNELKLDPYCRCSSTYKVTSPFFGKNSVPLSYDGNCLHNLLLAIHGRHFKTQLRPNKNVLKSFKYHIQPQLVLRPLSYDNYSIFKYLDKVKLTDQSKYKEYKEGYEWFRNSYDNPSQKHCTYEAFAKSGEVFYADPTNYTQLSNRPRLIFNPPSWQKIYIGYFSWVLIKELSQQFPAFVHALNLSELQDKINRCLPYSPDKVYISLDGSSHDSHQHAELLEIVDNFVFSQVDMRQLFPMLTKRKIDYLKKKILTTRSNITAYYPDKVARKKNKLLTMTINGTVFSGSPHRTTLGNTLRVMCYMSFVLQVPISELHNYCLVSGDDVVIQVHKDRVQWFKDRLFLFYSMDISNKVYGLGQCAKEVLVTGSDHLKFLSKEGFKTNKGMELVRILDRILTTGAASSSSVEKQHLQKNRRFNMILWSDGLPYLSDFVDRLPYGTAPVQQILDFTNEHLVHTADRDCEFFFKYYSQFKTQFQDSEFSCPELFI